jgi:hypothetical protein
MLWITEDVVIACWHETGTVKDYSPCQSWVTVADRRVLIGPDPIGRTITLCSNLPPLGKPCTTTIGVITGYSTLIKIDGMPLCIDSLTGPVDAPSPPYKVRTAGQTLVSSDL